MLADRRSRRAELTSAEHKTNRRFLGAAPQKRRAVLFVEVSLLRVRVGIASSRNAETYLPCAQLGFDLSIQWPRVPQCP